MTVPGKGGRPRKWRSDADRQRAWRARGAGTTEPPTLAQALDDGDELAAALDEVRSLRAKLQASHARVDQLEATVRAATRKAQASDRRATLLLAEIAGLRAENERLSTSVLTTPAPPVDDRNGPRRDPPSEPTAPAPPPLPRAERRRIERERRRSGGRPDSA